MAKYEKKIKGDFQKILSTLHNEILNSGFSMDLVDESNLNLNNVKVGVRVYDKYFMRNGNRASLSLTVVSEDDNIIISAIGAGGGSGVLFNFSLGAESDMVYIVENCVNKMNL
ncbi:DUF6054 family protein [Anaerovorax odorimutans]|uniref:DUF6054 family protein n=1 Tax=Anaerovorax odorimutans TaxID=109327 RepID=UPI0003F71919|nr:DUF6054 family protein [Anaerovorax odorimutans]